MKKYKLPIDYTKLHWTQRKEVREQYVQEQDNKCIHCKASLLENPPQKILDKRIDWSYFPPNFLKYPVHLQHDHKTNLTEVAVHAYCNAVLWQHHGR